MYYEKAFKIHQGHDQIMIKKQYTRKDILNIILCLAIAISFTLFLIINFKSFIFNVRNIIIAIASIFSIIYFTIQALKIIYNPKLGIIQISKKANLLTIREIFKNEVNINTKTIKDIYIVIDQKRDSIRGVSAIIKIDTQNQTQIECLRLYDPHIFIQNEEKIYKEITEILGEICNLIEKGIRLNNI